MNEGAAVAEEAKQTNVSPIAKLIAVPRVRVAFICISWISGFDELSS
jgi:hypothetical protein